MRSSPPFPGLPWPDRRTFLKLALLAVGGLAGEVDLLGVPLSEGGVGGAALSVLPPGPTPEPLPLPHFPSRLHAFVWRNWPLVPVSRMARVVGATRGDIVALGRAMGLGRPPRITAEQQSRSFITVIRRNWHLLPYEQLLDLLGWSAPDLAYTLREDDVLYIKLGSLKPRCDPLVYRASDAVTRRREDAMAAIVRETFPQGVGQGTVPLFGFVADLSKPRDTRRGSEAAASRADVGEGPRFCYSYFALFGDPLLEAKADPYPEGLLARLADAGVNGVWLQTPLYKLTPFPWDAGLSRDHARRLENLGALVERAGRHGIRVYLYLNEPRAMPLRFHELHPGMRGVVEGDHATLCTAVPAVREYLVEGVAAVCRAVPGLGGFFSITYSENLTHCWSHGGGAGCPRCAPGGPGEAVLGVNRLFQEGIRRSGTGARLLVWDWGWGESWAPSVIGQLPSEVALMSVSEWSLPIERGGVRSEVGEYSISAVGPGPRARRHWGLARARGLKAYAKIQAGNTWELSTVPYVPAVENVARHAEHLRAEGVDGLMLGWTLGGYPSPNLEVVAEAMAGASAEEAMRRVAERRFGPGLAPVAVAAWRGYSAAFREFPYHIGVCYTGPQQVGPANLLWNRPTGYKATMVGFPYDDLDGWRSIYPPDVFLRQWELVAGGFEQSLETARVAAGTVAPEVASAEQRRGFERECGVAEAAAVHFRSCANQVRFLQARRVVLEAGGRGEGLGVATAREAMRRVLRAEMDLARRLHDLQAGDSRVGFEASNQYAYVPVDLAEKVLNCRQLLDALAEP